MASSLKGRIDYTRAPAWKRSFMSAIAIYELMALWSDLPTITRMIHKNPKAAGLVLGVLSVHFVPEDIGA